MVIIIQTINEALAELGKCKEEQATMKLLQAERDRLRKELSRYYAVVEEYNCLAAKMVGLISECRLELLDAEMFLMYTFAGT
jgi:hypothetical protein